MRTSNQPLTNPALRATGLLALVVLAPLWVAGSGCAGSSTTGTPVDVASMASPVPEAATGTMPKPARRFTRAAVVAAHPLAAEAGAQMLRAGGSAVDAAVAVQAVLTLVEPQSSGIGGGAFLLHTDGRAVQAWDGRETAPAAADERLFLQADGMPMALTQAAVGGRAVGVPGVLHMLQAAHRVHGRLPWPRLFGPAVALAEAGFPVSPRLHALLAADPGLRSQPAAAAYFYGPDGAPHPVGHRLRNPALAAVLRQVAAHGAEAFYAGPVAADIVRAVRSHPANPGGLTEADLAGYRSLQRTALCTPWRAASARPWRVCGMPPPSSGHLAVMQLLGLMDADPAAAGPAASASDARADPTRVAWLHRWAEASRLAFADRALYVADPAFVAPPAGDWAALLDAAYLRQRAGLIGPVRSERMPAGDPAAPRPAREPLAHALPAARQSAPYAPQPEQPEGGTSHLSIVDGFGQAVAMTSTVESAFGSRLLVNGGTGLAGGFLLNHQLTDFAFRPADATGRPVANRVQAGKRPRSSMSPTLVFDARSGALQAVLGSPGGPVIVHFVARTLWGLHGLHGLHGLEPGPAAGADADAVQDQGLADLLAAPHAADVGGAALLLEAGRYPPATHAALRALGHPVQAVDLTSGLAVLLRTPGGWLAAADPRREGDAAGH